MPSSKQLPSRSEHQEQVAVFGWIRTIGILEWPELELAVGSAYGVRLRIGQAAKLKASGCLKKGWPDIFIAVPRARQDVAIIHNGAIGHSTAWYHGMFIELKPLTRGVKKPKREGPDKDQSRTLKTLSGRGYYTVCCFGAEAAIREIKGYMDNKK